MIRNLKVIGLSGGARMKILNEIIGDVEVDYKTGNLVEQGFIFRRLKYAHVCGCGEVLDYQNPC